MVQITLTMRINEIDDQSVYVQMTREVPQELGSELLNVVAASTNFFKAPFLACGTVRRGGTGRTYQPLLTRQH
jgi:hypothetical protein